MQQTRCINCMKEIAPEVHICQHCGYDQQAPQPSNFLRPNTILRGRYLTGRVIGKGGFGITYVGFDLTLEMKVAVKEYYPSGIASRNNSWSNQVVWESYSQDQDARAQRADSMERVLKEARRTARLADVSSVVRVTDAFCENETAYLVMDFIEGITLKDYLARHGAMSVDECKRLLFPVMEGLAEAHDLGIIHRDISPDNVMIRPDGTAKLLDLGAAVDTNANGGHASTLVVKNNFSALEQYDENGIIDSRTDVYAFAAMLYYCLTGKLMMPVMDRLAYQQELTFPPQPPLPAHVKETLARALAIRREERTPDMRTFERELAQEGAGEARRENPENQEKEEAERRKKLEELRRQEERKRLEEERWQARQEEQRRLEEQARQEEQRRLAEQARQEEERKQAERRKKPEKLKGQEEQSRQEEDRWLEEQRKQVEQARREKQRKGETPQPVKDDEMKTMPWNPNGNQDLHAQQKTQNAGTEKNMESKRTPGDTGKSRKSQDENEKKSPQKKRRLLALVAILCVVLLGNVIVALMGSTGSGKSNDTVETSILTETTGVSDVVSSGTNVIKNYQDWNLDATYTNVTGYVFGSEYKRAGITKIFFQSTFENEEAESWDVSEAEDGTVRAWVAKVNADEYYLYIAAEGGVVAPEDCSCMFAGYTNLLYIDFAEAFYTDNVNDMSNMFWCCRSLTGLNLSDFDTSEVTNMRRMFFDCSGLTELNVSGLDTSKVTNMSWMFYNCASLTELDVSGFDTSKVTEMECMFYDCISLTKLDVSKFDMSQVTDNTRRMFYNCSSLTSLTLWSGVTSFEQKVIYGNTGSSALIELIN